MGAYGAGGYGNEEPSTNLFLSALPPSATEEKL